MSKGVISYGFSAEGKKDVNSPRGECTNSTQRVSLEESDNPSYISIVAHGMLTFREVLDCSMKLTCSGYGFHQRDSRPSVRRSRRMDISALLLRKRGHPAY